MKHLRYIIVLVPFVLLMACNKSDDDSEEYLRWFDFRNMYGAKSQALTGNASGAFTITAADGTQVSFPAGAFVDAVTGAAITGAVNISMVEMISKKHLLFDGQMKLDLVSQWAEAGEVALNASQGVNAIKVNPAIGGPITVTMASSTGGGAGMNAWHRNDAVQWVMGDAASGSSTYSFNVQNLLSLGFLGNNYSCAKTDAFPRNVSVTVTPQYETGYNPDPATNDQVTFVTVVYKDAPTMVQLTANASPATYVNKSFSGMVTDNRQAVIVAYSGGPIPGSGTSGTYLYFGTQTVTLGAGQTYTIQLNKITKTNLDVFLATL